VVSQNSPLTFTLNQKLKIMIVKIYTHADRLSFLQDKMGTKLTDIVNEGDDLIRLTLEVNDAHDVMNVFHAGISYGLDAMSKSRTKQG
jgi:hypothetical protein